MFSVYQQPGVTKWLIKCSVCSIISSGSEMWILRKSDKTKLGKLWYIHGGE